MQEKLNPVWKKVSAAELVQDLALQFKPSASSKNISIAAEIPETPLPLVNADIALMERALGNLIDNAIKHTPENGAVTIKPEVNGELITISVTDTGEGIDKDDQDRIFDRFYQADKSRGTSGAGLGLSISQKILELHGSKLSVKSVLSEGTTFSFSLSTT